jgi:hypothetical protein
LQISKDFKIFLIDYYFNLLGVTTLRMEIESLNKREKNLIGEKNSLAQVKKNNT